MKSMITNLFFVQLKSAETDKEALQEQLSSLHDAYSREIADLSERLEKYKRKYSDKKQQSVSKLNTSRYVHINFSNFNQFHDCMHILSN